jgi:lipopolysaccharide transport system permease protein
MRWLSASRGLIESIFAPLANVAAIREGAVQLWRQRSLCKEMVRRDLGSQFSGQAIGAYWIIGHPLMLYVVYVFVFSVVLKTRMPTSLEMPRDYTTYILAGLAPWLSTQQVLARAPVALIGQAGLVKQVVFPIEILPLGAVIASAIPMLIGITVILLRDIFMFGEVPWTLLLLPIAFAIHAAVMLGLAYILASVTPFFRDVKDIVAVLTVVGVYLVPAFYLPQWVPASLQPWIYANPFSYIVWMYQDALYYGDIRHPYAWLISLGLAIASLALGLRTFRKLKPFVANVL